MNPGRLALAGIAIAFVGFLLVAIGTAAGQGAAGSSGGFVLIGPVPIVFGSGPNSGFLAAAGVVITVAMVGVYLVSFLIVRSRREREAEA
jgi:uncharacterized membrane protein